jgi:hypothetical protein
VGIRRFVQLPTKGASEMTELSKPRIVCAANRNNHSGDIAIGVRHFCPIMHQNIYNFCGAIDIDPLNMKDEYAFGWRTSEQGFIDQHGTFYTRKEAWKIADENGQIFRYRDWQTGSLHSKHLY